MTGGMTILALVLAVVALAGLFVNRIPAVLIAYCALCVAKFDGAEYLTWSRVWFWFAITALVLGIRFIQGNPYGQFRTGRYYVGAATICGVAVGYACMPAIAAIIVGGAVGAFLGTIAYMSTPRSPHYAVGTPDFLRFLSALGLPAVITCSMAAIVGATLL